MARRRRHNPPQKLASYDPHPHQIVFHEDTHKYRALVTGVGAGKTRMGVEEVIKWTQIYPGSFGVIGRLTAKALRETTQRRFFEVCPQSMIEDFNKSEGHLWIKTPYKNPDGSMLYSEILFVHLDDPGPLGSLDISYFWIDEAHEPDGAEVPEQTFQMLQARLRHPVGPWRGFITSNSGGKDWIYKWFFLPGNVKAEFKGWTASSSMNDKYLPPGYVAELRRNNPKIWVDRFLDASFDAFEGQVYVDFDEDVHVYDPQMVEISRNWDHGCGFDFGITAPTSCIYGAVDADDEIWVYEELYEPNADIDLFAAAIRDRGITEPFADPAVVARGPGKKSPKDLYQEEGVNLLPTSNDEDYFMTLFIKLLRKRVNGHAVLHISRRCPNLIEQIKREAWDPMTIVGTTHDKLKKQPNHARDAFKYFLNTFGLHPGLLTPLTPGFSQVSLAEFHESFADDEDLYDDKYPHKAIRRKILNG